MGTKAVIHVVAVLSPGSSTVRRVEQLLQQQTSFARVFSGVWLVDSELCSDDLCLAILSKTGTHYDVLVFSSSKHYGGWMNQTACDWLDAHNPEAPKAEK